MFFRRKVCVFSEGSDRMICPGPDEDSYKICVYCRACYPGLSPRVQELLDITINASPPLVYKSLVEAVMA